MGQSCAVTVGPARLPAEPDPGHLRERHRSPARRREVAVGQVGDLSALLGRLAQHDVDQPVALAVLADHAARERRARGLRDGLARHAERARLVLVDLQAQHLDRLVPVVVHAAHVRVRAQDLLGAVGPVAHLLHLWPDDAELHRIRHRRPVGQQLDAAAHLGEVGGQQLGQAPPERLARGQVLRQQYGRRFLSASRVVRSFGSRIAWLTLDCGKIWSSGR